MATKTLKHEIVRFEQYLRDEVEIEVRIDLVDGWYHVFAIHRNRKPARWQRRDEWGMRSLGAALNYVRRNFPHVIPVS